MPITGVGVNSNVPAAPHNDLRHAVETRFLLSAPEGKTTYPTMLFNQHVTDETPPFLQQWLYGQPRPSLPYLISKWSQWYFALLLTPWVYIHLRHQWQLPYRLADIAFLQSEQGTPQRFVLSSLGAPVEHDDWRTFLPLIDTHIAPVCQRLSTLSGLSPTLFWNNAGVRFYQGMIQAAQEGADVRRAAMLLDQRQFDNGEKNQIYQPIRMRTTPSGELKKERRHCCLIYRLDGGELCPTCPRLRARDRES